MSEQYFKLVSFELYTVLVQLWIALLEAKWLQLDYSDPKMYGPLLMSYGDCNVFVFMSTISLSTSASSIYFLGGNLNVLLVP